MPKNISEVILIIILSIVLGVCCALAPDTTVIVQGTADTVMTVEYNEVIYILTPLEVK